MACQHANYCTVYTVHRPKGQNRKPSVKETVDTGQDLMIMIFSDTKVRRVLMLNSVYEDNFYSFVFTYFFAVNISMYSVHCPKENRVSGI